MAKVKKIKIVSLFSGCGGMDLGLLGGFQFLDKRYRKFPVEIVYAIDNDKPSCDIYNTNFQHKCILEDVRRVDKRKIPGHDILVGGFPCQSFSIVAQNPPRLGYKDENGRLFFEMRDVLRAKQPRAFIAENVKGILSVNKKRAFPLIIEAFEAEGYHTIFSLLNSSEFGVPQKRERVFIIGFRNKKHLKSFEFPTAISTGKDKVPLRKVILSPSLIDKKYYFSERAVRGLRRANYAMNKGSAQNLNQPCNTINSHLAKVSLNSTDPVLFVRGKYRRFTPREAARIQSFPENFVFVGSDGSRYRAIGNAVPPVLMWHIAGKIYKALKQNSYDRCTYEGTAF